MKKVRPKVIIVTILLFSLTFGNTTINRFSHKFDITIQNKKGGKITIVQAGQETVIGKVKKPVTSVNHSGFTASKWSDVGTVAAAAVNAIHIKTGHNQKKNKGIIFSILPSIEIDEKTYKSYYDNSSSMVLNIAGGKSIFGGKWTPLLGNPVLLKVNKEFIPITLNYIPKQEDTIRISVLFPSPYPQEIIFENKFNGKVSVQYLSGEKKVIGKVLKPVLGIGRFIGTKYSAASRIRASHKGVIDVSTSPYNQVGGFQIIPAKHGESKEMVVAKTKTQWMVVAPVNEVDFELFSGVIIPRYYETDSATQNWTTEVSNRTLIQCKKTDSNQWQPLPVISVDPNKPLPNKMNTRLRNITHLKIMFPLPQEI